jgi:hypothetical protein
VCRIAFEKSKFIEIPMIEYLPGGVSSNCFKALKDGKMVYEKYYGHSIKLFFWQLRLKILYLLLQTKLGLLLNRIKIWLKMGNF